MSLDLKSNLHQINLSLVKPYSDSIYEFGDYRLEADHLMLYRGEATVPLTPKQVETLLALVEKNGEIVSKDELMTRLWGDSAVEESNLVQNIYILRKVLFDEADDKPLIETLRRRGYRFSGELKKRPDSERNEPRPLESQNRAAKRVEMLTTESGAYYLVSDQPDFKQKERAQSRNKAAALILGSALIIAVVILGYFFLVRSFPMADSAGKRSFAMLPMRPLDPASRVGLYEQGVADATINRLNSIDGFLARPLSATRKYSDLDPDPVAVGREQKVDYVILPNYQLADGKIRITTKVYNISTGNEADNYRFETEVSSVFALQDAFAEDLAKKLTTKFRVGPQIAPAKSGTHNEESYALYLQAMNLSEERGTQNVEKALECLERAVALDPNYGLAWAGIAHLHRDLVGQTDSGNREHYEKSMDAISRALAIDGNISDAYSALCQNKNRYEYDAAGAEAACKKALELDPNSPQAHKTYTNFLYSRGRFDEAIEHIKTAMELQPVSFRNQQGYGLSLLYARRYSEAEAQFKRLLELNPNHHYIHGQLALILELEGKNAEAYEYLIKKLILKKAENKVDDKTIERFKAAYAKGGWRGLTIERIKNQQAENIPGSFAVACLYAKLGNKDKAFEYLEKAFQERSFLIAVIEVAPQLDPLRDDSRFADLIRRIAGK